jgi:hypothetical protein
LKTYRGIKSIFLSITNKMQCHAIFYIIVNALHVLGSFSAHHQELKNCTHSIWYVPSLLAATVLELLMVGGKPPETCRH